MFRHPGVESEGVAQILVGVRLKVRPHARSQFPCAQPLPAHKRYRDKRGRMVTVLRVSLLAVEYSREGYRGESKVGRREFELKFTEVKS